MTTPADRAWTAVVSPTWKVSVTHPAVPEPTAPDLARLDDSALAREAARGSRDAFDRLVERHRRQVYRVCYRFAGNHEDASDLAQDAFLRAWRGLRSFRGQSAIATWLYRIAVNVCLDRAASRAPDLRPLEDSPPIASNDESPSEAVLRTERTRRVRAAVARLPRKQRATLILSVYHELPHVEIARILGSSVGAVKANVFHALVNLKRHLYEP
jgi:RNA polymerase sigma-70 factor (ECF subfamily)